MGPKIKRVYPVSSRFIQSHHISLKTENFSDQRQERCGRGRSQIPSRSKTLHHWWFEDGARNTRGSVGGLRELREGPLWQLAKMWGAQPTATENWILPTLWMSLRSGSTITPKTRQDQDPTASTCTSANTLGFRQFTTYINSTWKINQRLWSHTPERMTLSKRVQVTIMQTVEYLIAKVPIQGYSLAVLYPITLFWWRKGAWKKVPYLIITWEVMRKCLIGRLGAGEDDLTEVSYDAPILSCSGKITGTLPRLRRAALRAFICLV